MKNKYFIATLSVIVGLFFILSGFGKAVNTIGFTDTLSSYGLGYVSYLAPLICVAEILLGFLMLFLINPKKYSLYSLIVIILFTVSFGYAHFFKSVDDCGCFGEISILRSSPATSFIRNGILSIMCLIIFIYSDKQQLTLVKWKKIIIFSITALSLSLTGYTMSESLITKTPLENQKIENTPLAQYIKTSPDSTYIVFVFSYNCPHCWDATENIKAYLTTKTVDRVIGVAVGNKATEKEYLINFNPNFNIVTVPYDSLKGVIFYAPTAFVIKNNVIVSVMQKTVYSPHTFKKNHPTIFKK